MHVLEKLDNQLKTRATVLERLKREGRKVIGYHPGGYVPEELVLACGAIPVGLHRGGEHEPVQIAGAYLPRWIDTFCRSQIGIKVLGGEPAYDLSDMVIIPVTDNNVRILSDAWEFYGLGEVFKLGVPHRKTERAKAYYRDGLRALKDRLETFTGTTVTNDRLLGAIELCNQERSLFRRISLMRQQNVLPLSGRDYIRLLHASLWLDKGDMVGILDGLVQELESAEKPPETDTGPRVLLTGSTLAHGDDRVVRLVEAAGGHVVMEHFAEGLRHYWDDVTLEGDPIEALAESYFMRRITPAWFRPSREMWDGLIQWAVDFNAAGVIWYHLMYRDSYSVQSTLFPEVMKRATGLPTLVVESDYDLEELGPLRTRIEAFIEMINGK